MLFFRTTVSHLVFVIAPAFCGALTSWEDPLQQPLDKAATAKSYHETINTASLNYNVNGSELNALLALHKTLVSIPSVSDNEHDIAIFLCNYLKAQHLDVELQPVLPDSSLIVSRLHNSVSPKPRYNVFAHPRGHRQTPVLLTSHIDTVPPHIPYSIQNGDELWGRGTVDAKACVATQIFAYLHLARTGQINKDDVSLLLVVGEEKNGIGMRTANTLGLAWNTVIFGEPTELKLACGHKGLIILSIYAKGKNAHSGYPWLGESAIDMLLPALAALKQLKLPSSDKYGNSTVNIGFLSGGVAPNVIAEEAEARIGIRIAAGKAGSIRDLLFRTIKHVDERLEVNFVESMYGPVDIDHDVPGFETIIVNYGTDIPNMATELRRKTYLYGPGSILLAHGDREHLTIEDLKDAVSGYQKLLLHSLA